MVGGSRDEWLARCRTALEAGGFTSITTSETLGKIRANYAKLTVFGDLELTLFPEGESTRVNARATARVDNIWVLFGSPGRKILDRFKAGLAELPP